MVFVLLTAVTAKPTFVPGETHSNQLSGKDTDKQLVFKGAYKVTFVYRSILMD